MNNCRQGINDGSGCSAVLIKRLFDAVSLPLENASCVLTLCDGAQPIDMPSGSTDRQLASVFDLTLEDRCNYRKASGSICASGTASFNTAKGPAHAECTITLPFSCLIKYPEPSVIKPELSALVSFSFIATDRTDHQFNAVANGTVILTLCSYTPMSIPGSYAICPHPAPQESSPCTSLPLFPGCELP